MGTVKAMIRSLRLRTLPLSLSGVCLGLLLAAADYRISLSTAAFTMLTTIFLQILSNLSNELGDVLSGTDNGQRQGPAYGLNGGELSIGTMKMMIAVAVVACIAGGLVMLRSSFGTLFCMDSICLMLLGGAAIMAAMKYTLGRDPYGYRGLGDASVFLFFGIVAVLGSYFVATHTIGSWFLLLPAAAIGCFSVGVLNVNNIRDMKSDAATRSTVAIRLGEKGARIYQTVLIALGWILMTLYCVFRFQDPWHYLYFLSAPLFILHIKGIWSREGRALDPMLPLLVTGTFCFALLAGTGFVVFLF